jgi:hypothetical protein
MYMSASGHAFLSKLLSTKDTTFLLSFPICMREDDTCFSELDDRISVLAWACIAARSLWKTAPKNSSE